MPLVAFTCGCNCLFGRYIGDNEPLRASCPKCQQQVTDYCLPHTAGHTRSIHSVGDQYDYLSAVDGSHISSKRAHLEHLKRHGLIELGNEKQEMKPLHTQIPRESIRTELKNQVERMKSHGQWRER